MKVKCPGCGEMKFLKDFYRTKKTRKNPKGKSCYCKECERQRHRKKYSGKRKKEGAVYWCGAEQRYKVRNNCTGSSIFWSPQMIALLRRYYPTTKNQEVAEILGVSSRTMSRKAQELGLQKDKAFLHKTWKDNILIAHTLNRINGNSGQFRKGHVPYNKGLKRITILQ